MGKYPFVKEHIEDLATAACELAGVTLVDIRKEGSYSRYVAVIGDGNSECELAMPYDYMLMVVPEKRVEAAAAEIRAMFPPAVVVEPAAEAAEVEENEPQPPKRTRKQAK